MNMFLNNKSNNGPYESLVDLSNIVSDTSNESPSNAHQTTDGNGDVVNYNGPKGEQK